MTAHDLALAKMVVDAAAKIRPTDTQLSETLQLFRRELDKNMDVRHGSASPGHDAMRVALHYLFGETEKAILALDLTSLPVERLPEDRDGERYRWWVADHQITWAHAGPGLVKWVRYVQMEDPDVSEGKLTETSVQDELETAVDDAIAEARQILAAPADRGAGQGDPRELLRWAAELLKAAYKEVSQGYDHPAEAASEWDHDAGYCAQQIETYLAQPAGAQAGQTWIPVDARLPSVGEWANVLQDHDSGDWAHRMFHKGDRYTVRAALLRNIDSEGSGYWECGRLSSGTALEDIEHVTHWMPLPSPPDSPRGGK